MPLLSPDARLWRKTNDSGKAGWWVSRLDELNMHGNSDKAPAPSQLPEVKLWQITLGA
ncbi:hypothetical protein HFC70_10560 [Agrobacterium sp. a22-2]|uniref:hypothetical protein n=1 Tax=Agrobacterium sp. a22-2 TaxID=2283840 RepID=UPI001444BA05|nr:hypothetical protein [Agrobacterium sp. a22-2]NKN36797.1 hypothetical protein [Agrobacterium sp. a22-2]